MSKSSDVTRRTAIRVAIAGAAAVATGAARAPRQEAGDMERVQGIGGFFFRAKDPKKLAEWYEANLGVPSMPHNWRTSAGTTVFAPFKEDTSYFGDRRFQWMINFRVRDLDNQPAAPRGRRGLRHARGPRAHRRHLLRRQGAHRRPRLDLCIYSVAEIERIARVAFRSARSKVCSVDKADVLETSRLWREVVRRVHSEEFPHIELEHALVDSTAMKLVTAPRHFDVILTENMFGDILSDEAGASPARSACCRARRSATAGPGLFEPVHGSAPDIAGQGIANPLAMFLSAALMLRHGLDSESEAAAARIGGGPRPAPTGCGPRTSVATPSTAEATDAVLAHLSRSRRGASGPHLDERGVRRLGGRRRSTCSRTACTTAPASSRASAATTPRSARPCSATPTTSTACSSRPSSTTCRSRSTASSCARRRSSSSAATASAPATSARWSSAVTGRWACSRSTPAST